MTPPALNPRNAALLELRAWLTAERATGRDALEAEADPRKIATMQGRLGLLAELLRLSDPERQHYGVRAVE